MSKWKQHYHDEINGPDFTAEAMKAMVDVRPNPGFWQVDADTAYLGESPLLCLPPVKGEKVANELIQKAQMLSVHNATFSDHIRVLSTAGKLGALPMPPTNYAALLRVICTYSAKLASIWTENCSHYQQVMEIRKILKSPKIENSADDFSADQCGKIIYAICLDSRQFFYKRLHPNSLARQSADYPVLMLGHINQYVTMNTPIPTDHNHPPRWAAAASVYDAARNAMAFGGAFNRLDGRAFPLGQAGGASGGMQDPVTAFQAMSATWGGAPLPKAPPPPAPAPAIPPAPAW